MSSAVPAVLGIDIGTGSTKGVLVDGGGRVLATVVVAHGVRLPQPGWVEQDADAVWWRDVGVVARRLLAEASVELRAVCISGVGPCVVPLSRSGAPLRPAILYGIDTRAEAEVRALTEALGEDEILARTGSLLSSQSAGPKILWIRNNEPETWDRTEKVASSSSYVVLRLTGEYVLDHHTASQYQPLYDLEARAWDARWSSGIVGSLELPRLAWPGEVVGTVTPAAAGESGIPAGTPVCAGTVDAWAEGVSIGADRPGELMIMYGSTFFLTATTRQSLRSPALWSTNGVWPDAPSLAAGTATGGLVAGWLAELASESHGALAAEAATVAAGADGLVVLPYFEGERTPLFDPSARGLIAGLTLRHGRAHLYRAALEGVAYAIRHILEAFTATGVEIARVHAVGGGVEGALWPQIVSDVTGLDQLLAPDGVSASYGDAVLAAIACGFTTRDERWPAERRAVAPRAEPAARYDELYAVFRELYPATRRQAHELARIQRGDAVAASVLA